MHKKMQDWHVSTTANEQQIGNGNSTKTAMEGQNYWKQRYLFHHRENALFCREEAERARSHVRKSIVRSCHAYDFLTSWQPQLMKSALNKSGNSIPKVHLQQR
jgi:hypothetical protein